MSEFTKGPWTVRKTGKHWNNPDLENIEINCGSDQECICDTVYRIEDANLIAAAPDMLDELECSRRTWIHMRACWVTVHSNQQELQGWAEDQIEICNIRIAQHDKAIAKKKPKERLNEQLYTDNDNSV